MFLFSKFNDFPTIKNTCGTYIFRICSVLNRWSFVLFFWIWFKVQSFWIQHVTWDSWIQSAGGSVMAKLLGCVWGELLFGVWQGTRRGSPKICQVNEVTNNNLWAKKTPLTIDYTGCLEILTIVYCNPPKAVQYNPLYTQNNQFFFNAPLNSGHVFTHVLPHQKGCKPQTLTVWLLYLPTKWAPKTVNE